MDFIVRLENLIKSQSPTSSSTADILAELGSPSVSIAVLDHGSITSKSISTIGDNTETLFQACSISKPIAGMATMRLVQQGKLKVDDKIVDLLPARIIQILETPQTIALLKQVTVRQLLSHTSGFSVSGVPGYTHDPPTAEDLLSGKAPANTQRMRIEGIPGHMFSYSGGGMTVLQLVLETVTGKDFPSLIQELVLDPLEMTRSFYTLASGEKNVTRAYLNGYTPCISSHHTFPEQAAAGLWTTPTDLLKTVRAMQRSLHPSTSSSYLEQEIAREMLTEVLSDMALSWVAPKNPGTVFGHGGNNYPGWHCFLLGFANLRRESIATQSDNLEECGISIMTNSMGGMKVWMKVMHAITYLKKWSSIPPLVGGSPYGRVPFCDYSGRIDEKWIEWKGTWADGEKHLQLEADEEGSPILRFGEKIEVKLVPAAISSVEYGDRNTSVDFVLDGLEIMFRLGWKDRKRSVERWHGGLGSVNTLTKYDGIQPKS